MLKSLDYHVLTEPAPILLERNGDGTFPFPSMRCGIIPYFYRDNHILWGGVRSDRLGPTTITFPAGTQDILITKDDQTFSLEASKPLPDLGYDFIQEFVGQLFRDQTYQNVIHAFYENGFTVYIENPLATAIHESAEEHGIDLRPLIGRDFHLIESIIQLPIQKVSNQNVYLWIVFIKNIEGIVLKETDKIEQKIRRNFGRKFCEQGCWFDLNELKANFLELKDGVDSGKYTHSHMDLLHHDIKKYKETIKLFDSLEWLIRGKFKLSQFPRGLYPLFSKPHLRSENSITDIFTVKTALQSISYDTWLVLDLDNTVMHSMLDLAGDYWFENLLIHATQCIPDNPKEALKLSLLIYGAVQAHVRVQPVETQIVKIIRALQDIGIPVIALTARQSSIKHSTVLQLNSIGIDFFRNCITNVSIPAYHEGIIFCDAKNKGTVWQAFIEKSPRRPRHIVMLDDKLKHLIRMSETTQRLNMNFTGFKYGFFEQKENKFNMEIANQQLAFLKKYLPMPVQQAIDQLQLIPDDFEPTLIQQKYFYGFFKDTIANHFDGVRSQSPCGISPVFSSSPQKNENSITNIITVKTALKSISYDTWLVLDLDNTVMYSMLDLASDYWFENLLIHATQCIPDNPKEALKLSLLIYGAVQAHVRVQPVETQIVKIIRALQDIGIPVIALTARQSSIKLSTVRQLNAIGIDFSRNSITNVSMPAYYEGIIFCDAENKGTVWQAFIEKSPSRPRHIVMLDDKLKHLIRISETTQHLNMNFTGFKYGFLEQKVNEFNMEIANQQLAFLKKYLPMSVQQAIDQLQLIPVDFEPTLIPQKYFYGFFKDTIANHFDGVRDRSPCL